MLAKVSVQLHLLRVGACRHLACMAARGAGWRWVDFPALCGLIRHPQQGWLLFDTGYAEHFFTTTAQWPERLYRALLPVSLPAHDSLHRQLAHHGLAPADIGHVIISHYHGDHVAGLRDFPRARFFASAADTAHCLNLAGKRWRATLQAQLPGLLPPDFAHRWQAIENCARRDLPGWLTPFTQGFDLLGDGSLLAVPLPGHSHGQSGLFLPDVAGRPVFLVADACWSLPALQADCLPSRLTGFLQAGGQDYARTFHALHRLSRQEPALTLLPSHCPVAWEAFHAAS